MCKLFYDTLQDIEKIPYLGVCMYVCMLPRCMYVCMCDFMSGCAQDIQKMPYVACMRMCVNVCMHECLCVKLFHKPLQDI